MQWERVQKNPLSIILASQYENYTTALNISGIQTLSERRKTLCKKFAKNCIKNEQMSQMFPLNSSNVSTRFKEKFHVQPAATEKLAKSAIPYMQRLLNEDR